MRDQRGGTVVVLIIVALVAMISAVWYFAVYAKKHPATTNLIVPSEDQSASYKNAVDSSKSLQNKYQTPPEPQ